MAFTLPLSKRLMPLLIILWLINSVVLVIKGWSKITKQNVLSPLLWLYLVYVVYYFVSPYKDAAAFDLEVKLSLLLFPFGFFFTGNYLPKKEVVFKAFVSGSVVAVLLLLIRAVAMYFITHKIDYFAYGGFSAIMHTSYFSMYLLWGVFLLLSNLFSGKQITYFKVWQQLAFVLLLTMGIVLSASKTGVLILVLLMMYALVLYYLRYRNILKTVFITTLVVVLSIVFVMKNETIKARFTELLVTVENNDNQRFSSTSARQQVWLVAIDLIKEKPLGYGTGAERKVLRKTYLENNMMEAYKHNLNAHNQFLQTFLAVGIVGFIVFMLVFLWSFIDAWKNGNVYFLAFLLLTGINFFTESMLETQAGVVFFAFFYSLLFAYNQKEKRIFGHIKP